MIDKDCFLDDDVNELLNDIRRTQEGSFSVIRFDDVDLSLLYDMKNKQYTNYYASNISEDIKKQLLDRCKGSSTNIICLGVKSSDDRVIAGIDTQNFDLSYFHKGHKYNVKRAIKLGVKSTIYYGSECTGEVLRDFYDCCVISRKNIKKSFTHTFKSFELRNELIKKKKGILSVTEYEGKKSYVFTICSKNNAMYFDSGYNILEHPFTAHYAQYKLIETLKQDGNTFYSLGAIDMSIIDGESKHATVDYYKKGFCKDLYSYKSI